MFLIEKKSVYVDIRYVDVYRHENVDIVVRAYVNRYQRKYRYNNSLLPIYQYAYGDAVQNIRHIMTGLALIIYHGLRLSMIQQASTEIQQKAVKSYNTISRQ